MASVSVMPAQAIQQVATHARQQVVVLEPAADGQGIEVIAHHLGTEILLGGLAPDGGLYLPESYPRFSETDLAAVKELAEAREVLDWAHAHFPGRHGAVEDGHAWDHELLVQHEDGGWITVTLTFSASPEFAEAFQAVFVSPEDD